jgi:hypothetical protein
MSSTTNGAVILKSFADLPQYLDLETLPPGPPEPDEVSGNVDLEPAQRDGNPLDSVTEPSPTAPPDLASLVAQLAGVTSRLEAAASEDARARQQATVELAHYEALAAERREAERALAEARRVRMAAELLSRQAFTEHARAQAARDAGVARAAEVACAELMAERTRAADELANRPHLARVIADQRRREQEQADAARRADEERATRLADGIVAARSALADGRVNDARQLLAPLARDFPTNDQVQSVLDVVRWRARSWSSVPHRRRCARSAGVSSATTPRVPSLGSPTSRSKDLPEDLARQVFGVWSNACFQLVQQRGWHEPLRYSVVTSRGAVLVRHTADSPHEVLSALGMGPDWYAGKVVTDERLLRAARPLLPRKQMGGV